MEGKRVPVYGKDMEDHEKRAFDWLLVDGQPMIETKDKKGNKVKIPMSRVIAGYKKLIQKRTEKTNG